MQLTERCLMCKLEIQLNAIFGHLCDMEMFIPLENECQNEWYHFGMYSYQSSVWFSTVQTVVIDLQNGKLKDIVRKRPTEMRQKNFTHT